MDDKCGHVSHQEVAIVVKIESKRETLAEHHTRQVLIKIFMPFL